MRWHKEGVETIPVSVQSPRLHIHGILSPQDYGEKRATEPPQAMSTFDLMREQYKTDAQIIPRYKIGMLSPNPQPRSSGKRMQDELQWRQHS
jgi:hypothetical protein